MLLRSAAYVASALARQYGSVAALHRLQLRRLHAMLAHAVHQVPYYRDEAAYRRYPLRSLAELRELPILTKTQMRAHYGDLIADDADPERCCRVTTSGTTGHRMVVVHNTGHDDRQNAAVVRRLMATGRYLPTHRMCAIRVQPIDSFGFQRYGLFRRHVILTTEPVERWPDLLLRHRPHALLGYPVHLRELLRTLSPDQLAALRRSLRLVLTDSELLVDAERAAITAALGVPVFDEYSSFETLQITYECSRGGRHIAEDLLYVEVVDDDGAPVPDGVEGRIVCTAFHERAMPLIRFNLGDLGVIDPEPCSCRRRFRTMRVTKGRANDSITLPDGRRLFADRFLIMVVEHPGVAGMFVRQDAAGAVQVNVAPDGTVPVEEVLTTVREVILKQARQEFALEVVPVDHIPLTPGGKARFLESAYQPGGAGQPE
jgi:phenylacetate-CoA ligase